jgi:hypothetical protein
MITGSVYVYVAIQEEEIADGYDTKIEGVFHSLERAMGVLNTYGGEWVAQSNGRSWYAIYKDGTASVERMEIQ